MEIGKIGRSCEQRLIERIKDWAGSTLIGDDCACLPGGLLVSTDSLAQGTHFRLATTSLADLGWKAAAVNLSDLAAMAGRPRYLFLSLGYPAATPVEAIGELYRGFADGAAAYRTRVAGGDLFQSPQLILNVTVLGDAHESGLLTRKGACAGDVVAVTGDFGASAAGLFLLEQAVAADDDADLSSVCPLPSVRALARARSSYCIERHRRPRPRLCESWALARACRGRGALMDASDGLGDAVYQLAVASAVGMAIDLDQVPVHQETLEVARRAGVDPLDWILYGGEDYELVACIPSDVWERLSGRADNPFKRIGVVDGSPEITLHRGGQPGPALELTRGFQHFQEG